MDAISIKLPAELRRRLAYEAKRRNVTQSAVVRDLIERGLTGTAARRRPATCAELMGDLLGAVRSGRSDLATNKTLLEDAMLEGARRGPERRR